MLLWHVHQGDAATVALLLAAEADVNQRRGATPLTLASGNAEITQLLLYAKASPDAANSRGETPLSLASADGPGASVKMLLVR